MGVVVVNVVGVTKVVLGTAIEVTAIVSVVIAAGLCWP